MKKKSLLSRFADADYVVKMQLWTPDRGQAKFEGGYPEVVGDLILLSASIGMGKVSPKDEKAMRVALETLYPEKYGKEAITKFGQRLKKARTGLPMSQRELGELLGCSHVHVGAVERGKSGISKLKRAKLEEIFPELAKSTPKRR